MKRGWPIMLGLLLLLIPGCREEEYTISVRYHDTADLAENATVAINGESIGRVTGIEKLGSSRFLVTLRIDPAYANQITRYASFEIAESDSGSKKTSIAVRLAQSGGEALPSGSVVDGVEPVKPSLFGNLQQQLKNELGQLQGHLGELSGNWDDIIREFRELPEKEAVKKLQRELEDLGRAMKESRREWKDKIQKDLLPRLRKELDRLEERLRQKGLEEDTEPLKVRMEELQTI